MPITNIRGGVIFAWGSLLKTYWHCKHNHPPRQSRSFVLALPFSISISLSLYLLLLFPLPSLLSLIVHPSLPGFLCRFSLFFSSGLLCLRFSFILSLLSLPLLSFLGQAGGGPLHRHAACAHLSDVGGVSSAPLSARQGVQAELLIFHKQKTGVKTFLIQKAEIGEEC